MPGPNPYIIDTDSIIIRNGFFMLSNSYIPQSTNFIVTVGASGEIAYTDALVNLSTYGVGYLPSVFSTMNGQLSNLSTTIYNGGVTYADFSTACESLSTNIVDLSNWTKPQLSTLSTSIGDLSNLFNTTIYASSVTQGQLLSTTASLESSINVNSTLTGESISSAYALMLTNPSGYALSTTVVSLSTYVYSTLTPYVDTINENLTATASTQGVKISSLYGEFYELSSFAVYLFLSTPIVELSTLSAGQNVLTANLSSLSSFTTSLASSVSTSYVLLSNLSSALSTTNSGLATVSSSLSNYATLANLSTLSTSIGDINTVLSNSVTGNNISTLSTALSSYATLANLSTLSTSLENYATKASLSTLSTSLNGYATLANLSTLSISLENYATKSNLSTLSISLNNYATKANLSTLSTALSGYATLANLSTLSTSLENYATKANLSTLSTALSGYATLANLSTLSTSLENYATKANLSTLSTALSGYATLANLSTLSTSLENYATKANLSTLSTALSGYATLANLSTLSTSLENYATKENLSTLSTALSGYATLANLSTLSTALSGYATLANLSTLSTSLENYATKENLSTLSTALSNYATLANLSTLSTSLETYATKANLSTLSTSLENYATKANLSTLSTVLSNYVTLSNLSSLAVSSISFTYLTGTGPLSIGYLPSTAVSIQGNISTTTDTVDITGGVTIHNQDAPSLTLRNDLLAASATGVEILMCNATSVGRFGQGGPVRGTYINVAAGDAITMNSNRHVGIYGAYNTNFGLFVNGSLYASTIIASTITASTITGYATLANLSTLSTSLENYATNVNLSTLSTSMENYATKDNLSTLSTALNRYATLDNLSTLSTSLSNYVAFSNLSTLGVSTLLTNSAISLYTFATSTVTASTITIGGFSNTRGSSNPCFDMTGAGRIKTSSNQTLWLEYLGTTVNVGPEIVFKTTLSAVVQAIGAERTGNRGMFFYTGFGDAINIDINRNVSIDRGSTQSAYKLFVNGNTYTSTISTLYQESRFQYIQSTLTISTGMAIGTTSTAGYLLNANGGDINITNGVLRINNAQQIPVSDERIKENISSISLETCLSTLESVPLRTYNFRADYAAYAGMTAQPQVGVIAQEIADIFPGSIQKIPQYGIEDLHFINYNQLYLTAVGATKKLAERERIHTSTIQGLQQQIQAINSFLMATHSVPSII